MSYANHDEKTIDGRVYVAHTEQLLKAKGIVIEDETSTNANCVISVGHDTNYGKEQRLGHTWGQTGVSSSNSTTYTHASAYNIGNTTYGYGRSNTQTTYNPTYGITGTYTYDVPRSYIIFGMDAVDAATESEIWKISVSHAGHVDNKFINIFPLFKCILSRYLFRNYDGTIALSKKEIDMIAHNECSSVEFPGIPSLSSITKEAKKGNPDAQLLLGNMYYSGKGANQDTAQALYWFTEAANKGHAKAQLALGNIYYQGIGVEKDLSKGAYWYSKAAEQNDPVAQESLGYVYSDEEGAEKDESKAFYWFSKAANQGLAASQWAIASMYYQGVGTTKDEKKAQFWGLKSATQGYVGAQKLLGDMYLEKKDKETAFQWYSKAAEQGDPESELMVAFMYYSGDGVKQDIKKAMDIMATHAEKDYAAEALISCYTDDINSLTQHFNKCLTKAKQGNAKAQYAVALAYYNGWSVNKDIKKSYEWLVKAAAQDKKYEEDKNEMASQIK